MPEARRADAFVITAAVIIVLAGIIYAQSLVTSVLMALFVSIICAQPIFWLQAKGLPQAGAIMTVFLGILLVTLGLGEVIKGSLSSFSGNVALYEDNLNALEGSFLQFLSNIGIQVSAEQLAGQFDPSSVMGLTAGILSQFGSVMGSTVTIIFLVLFLLMELDSIPVKVRAIYKEKAGSLKYFNVIGQSIRHYLSIKTLTSLLTGLLVWIMLVVIGLDYAILWGLIAFMLNYIPNIGSFIAAVPAILFAMIQLGVSGTIATVVIFLVSNLLIGNFVEPRLMGKGLGLSTFVVFFSLIFWGFVLGTVGMFLSVPLTIAIKVILQQYPATRGFAIALGTKDEADKILQQDE